MTFTPELLAKTAEQTLTPITLGSGLSLTGSTLDTKDTPALFIAAGSNQSVTNSTSPTASALVLALVASATYTGEALLVYDGSTTGDFKVSMTWPSGASGWYCADSALAPAGTAMTTLFSAASGGTLGVGALGVGSKQLIRIDWSLITSSAGNLTLNFAQNTLDAVNASTLYAGSYLAARRRA